ETCAFLLREGKVDPNPLDRFLHTPLDDAIRHGHKDVAELLIKFKGRPSTDDEYLSTVRDEFLKQMEEEKARKDTDKLDKELKTHKFSEVLERLARLRSDLEDDVYQFMTSAANIRYELCRILHMNMHDESSRTRAGWDRLTQQLLELDSSASRILKTISGDVFPWLNSACNNFHTRGLVLLLLPNFSDHLSKLVVVLNHVKALLPRLISQLVSPSGLGYDCRVFGLLCQRPPGVRWLSALGV
ncbi:SKOR, partial [Symbiodinium sp. CCMP2592]